MVPLRAARASSYGSSRSRDRERVQVITHLCSNAGEGLKELCFDKNVILSFSPAHQPSSNGMRMVGILKSTVLRMLKQAHVEREWWSYACQFAGQMMREKVLGRPWQFPLFGQLVGIWRARDKDRIKSLDDRGAVGYPFDIDIWQSGATRKA